MANPDDYAELQRLADHYHQLGKRAHRNVRNFRKGPSRDICKVKAKAFQACSSVFSNAYLEAVKGDSTDNK